LPYQIVVLYSPEVGFIIEVNVVCALNTGYVVCEDDDGDEGGGGGGGGDCSCGGVGSRADGGRKLRERLKKILIFDDWKKKMKLEVPGKSSNARSQPRNVPPSMAYSLNLLTFP